MIKAAPRRGVPHPKLKGSTTHVLSTPTAKTVLIYKDGKKYTPEEWAEKRKEMGLASNNILIKMGFPTRTLTK